MKASLFIISALTLALATPAGAAVKVSKQISYFTIHGRTAADLDRDLDRKGPSSAETGRRHPGMTRIRFGGAATYMQKNGRCRISEANVTLELSIMLPRWKERRKVGGRVGFIWDTLSADIKRHEDRHAEIARQHARALEQRLKRLPAENDCKAMQARVAEASAEEMEAHDADQARFDRIEAANFENRMMRLLQTRLSRSK